MCAAVKLVSQILPRIAQSFPEPHVLGSKESEGLVWRKMLSNAMQHLSAYPVSFLLHPHC